MRTLLHGLLGATLGGVIAATLFGLLMWVASPSIGGALSAPVLAVAARPFAFLVALIFSGGSLEDARMFMNGETGIVAYLLGVHLLAASIGALIGGGIGVGLSSRRAA